MQSFDQSIEEVSSGLISVGLELDSYAIPTQFISIFPFNLLPYDNVKDVTNCTLKTSMSI